MQAISHDYVLMGSHITTDEEYTGAQLPRALDCCGLRLADVFRRDSAKAEVRRDMMAA
jgi:hypothetical protein